MGASRYEIFEGAPDNDDSTQRFFWRLVAGNGEIVAQSEGYTRREGAKRGAIDAQQTSYDAEIVDAE